MAVIVSCVLVVTGIVLGGGGGGGGGGGDGHELWLHTPLVDHITVACGAQYVPGAHGISAGFASLFHTQ